LLCTYYGFVEIFCGHLTWLIVFPHFPKACRLANYYSGCAANGTGLLSKDTIDCYIKEHTRVQRWKGHSPSCVWFIIMS
jgi:hypothetical protein